MRIRDEETIKFVASRGPKGIEDPTIQKLAMGVGTINVFEAVCAGTVTAEEGSYVIIARRVGEYAALPWYVRTAIWLACALGYERLP